VAEHVRAGLVTVTLDDDGRPFEWSKVTGKILVIHSQEGRPQKAYVAVEELSAGHLPGRVLR
jgi:hypothetical protein